MDLSHSVHEAVRRAKAAFPKGGLPRGRDPPPAVDADQLRASIKQVAQKLSHCEELTRSMSAAARQRSLFADRGAEITAQSAVVKAAIADVEARLGRIDGEAAAAFGKGSSSHKHWSAACSVLVEAMGKVALAQQQALSTRLATVQRRAAGASRKGGSIVTGRWVAPSGLEEAASQLRPLRPGSGLRQRGAGAGRAGSPASTGGGGDSPASGGGSGREESNPFLRSRPGGSAPGSGGGRAAGTAAGVAPGSGDGGGAFTRSPGSALARRSAARRQGGYLSSQQQAAAVHRRAVARQDDAADVERAVVEVGRVVRHVAALTAEQGETLGRISANVTEAGREFEGAQAELVKLLGVVSKNRPILIALLFITAVVVVTMMLLGS